MEPHDLAELIDACRPGSKDVGMPEMRVLAEQIERDPVVRQHYEQVQGLDTAIRAAMEQVPIPEGLTDRMLAALEASPAVTSAGAIDLARADLGVSGGTRVAEQSPRWTGRARRRFVAAALSVVAAVLAVAIAVWPRNSQPLTEENMPGRVSRWTASIDPSRWQGAGFPFREFPPSANVLFVTPRRWQHVPGRSAERIVCYDLKLSKSGPLLPPGTGQLLLFIMQTRQRLSLPATPRNVPRCVTLGWCIGSWQEDGLVYSLAIQGSGSLYQRLVPPPSIAATPTRISSPG